MESEEHLTLFDNMRTQCKHFEKLFDQQASLALTKQGKIDEIVAEFANKEKMRLEGKEDKECQTIIGQKYFENKKTDLSSRNGSGSLGTGSQRTAGAPAPSGGKRVGGGGTIAKRPPPRPNANGSRNADGSQGSKGPLRMDTASSHNSKGQASNYDGATPVIRQQSGNRSQVPPIQRSGDSNLDKTSRMNDDGIATPRNLTDKNQHGSGTLPEGKRSMDGVVAGQQSADSKELLNHVQSATQSQQFKTMDNSKS